MSTVSAERRKELRADDSNWKLGIFYFSPHDPAFLIPKRFGIGWTLNFGSVWAGVVVLALIAVLIWGIWF